MSTKPETIELTSYDEDFLLWSEEQAELLRRRAEARPEAFVGLDIDNLVEEIGDLGISQLRAAEGYLFQVFRHLIKLVSDPIAWSHRHWLDEVRLFQVNLARAYLPSMRRRIDVHGEWQKARRVVLQDLKPYRKAIAAGVPERCPFTLDELLADDFDFEEAVARLGGSLDPELLQR